VATQPSVSLRRQPKAKDRFETKRALNGLTLPLLVSAWLVVVAAALVLSARGIARKFVRGLNPVDAVAVRLGCVALGIFVIVGDIGLTLAYFLTQITAGLIAITLAAEFAVIGASIFRIRRAVTPSRERD
jgi:hypothetical protein